MNGPSLRQTPPARGRAALGYLAMVAVAVGVFLFIRWHGLELTAPAPAAGAGFNAHAPRVGPETLTHVLIALAVVIVAARGLGALFSKLHQPAVIGEVVAGILLGPSLLGRIAPEVSAFVLSAQVAPFLSVIAQVGVILYMASTGVSRRRWARS